MTTRTPKGWKALLAMLVGVGAVAWHVMACVESPMSFSPNGDLAFTVMDPYGMEEIGTSGNTVYRVMILGPDRALRVVDSSRSHLLSGPGYSPDGRRIAYLRIPNIEAADKERISGFIEQRFSSVEEARNAPAERKWIYVAPEGSIDRPADDPMRDIEDLVLPGPGKTGSIRDALSLGGGIVPVDLVVRDAVSGAIVRTIAVDVPWMEGDGLPYTYLLSRPQYSADGASIHFSINFLSVAVDLENGGKRLFAAQTLGSALAPGGRTVAILWPDDKRLGLVRTDGRRATYVRLEREPSVSGLAWAGADTLLVVGDGRRNGTVALDFYDTDGDLVRAAELPIVKGTADSSGEVALSPDGRHIVISFGDVVHWLTYEGRILKSWQAADDGELLVQPAFTPDSRQVAFKSMNEEKSDGKSTWTGTAAIAFFTPEGRELFRVPVPRAEAPPRPQTQPTGP